MSRVISAPININAYDLISQVAGAAPIENFNETYFDGSEGRFISCKTGGLLVACCYHQAKNHTAVVEVHNGFTSLFGASDKIVRSSRGTACGGKWATAITDSGRLGGDRAYYECN